MHVCDGVTLLHIQQPTLSSKYLRCYVLISMEGNKYGRDVSLVSREDRHSEIRMHCSTDELRIVFKVSRKLRAVAKAQCLWLEQPLRLISC